MKRSWALVFLLLVFCVPASAQSDWRVFGGFSFNGIDYLPADLSSQQGLLGVDDVNMYGWSASVTHYTSLKWLGATVETGGLYKTPTITIPADYFEPGVPETDTEFDNVLHASMYSAMIGPSFAYRNNPNFEPFAHALMGGIYSKAKLSSAGRLLAGRSGESSEWAFGYALGGGADFKISKLLAIRGQIDYIRSMFGDGMKDRQNNIRVSCGLVLHLSE
ncbi:MAG: outer membrane beta-barrel protein [Acidobacteriota bacterium]|jgi:opacity protein-like surface antigen